MRQFLKTLMEEPLGLTTTLRECPKRSDNVDNYYWVFLFVCFSKDIMIWSDTERNIIYKKNLHGTGLQMELVTTNIAGVGM